MFKNIDNINNLKVSFAHLFLFVLIFTGANQPIIAQAFDNLSKIQAAYEDILKLKLASGRKSLDGLPSEEKKSGHYFYVRNTADVLELIITQDEGLYKKYAHNEEGNLKGLKNTDENSPYRLFYESEIKLQWVLVKMLFGDNIKAGLSLRSSYNTIHKNQKRFPSFIPNNKTLGMLHILLSTVPDNSAWLLNLFGITGDLKQGLSELESITEESTYYKEAQLIKILAYVNILNKPEESLKLLEQLISKERNNLLLNYIHSSTLIKFGQSERALTKLSKLQYHGKDYLFLNYINYKLAEIYMQKKEYRTARNYYSLFLNNYRGQDLVKDAWFKISLTYWLSDNENMAKVHFKKAQSSGRAFADADKNASGILNTDAFPNKKLMQLRLATDGGFFQIASDLANLISESSFDTKKEKTEYFYRLGRFNHKSGSLDEAIYYYLNTIKKSGRESWYFAPNACLQTGYIYQGKGDLEKAEFYFDKALNYKKHKYKTSIDNEARAAKMNLGNN